MKLCSKSEGISSEAPKEPPKNSNPDELLDERGRNCGRFPEKLPVEFRRNFLGIAGWIPEELLEEFLEVRNSWGTSRGIPGGPLKELRRYSASGENARRWLRKISLEQCLKEFPRRNSGRYLQRKFCTKSSEELLLEIRSNSWRKSLEKFFTSSEVSLEISGEIQ